MAGVAGVECEAWSVEFGVGSVKCGVECEVWSGEFEVWSVKF